MARRMILGRRGAEYGLWVSKPGFDAETGIESQLAFSMGKRHGMVVASGTVLCPGGGQTTSISFGYPQPSVPLIFCGDLVTRPSAFPIATLASQTGFTIQPLPIWDGTYPAAGRAFPWFAVAKSQD